MNSATRDFKELSLKDSETFVVSKAPGSPVRGPPGDEETPTKDLDGDSPSNLQHAQVSDKT